MSSPIYKTIATLIEREKQLTTSVHVNDHLGMDLGFDSLNRVEFIAVLEKQFNINIPETFIAKVSTVRDLICMITQLVTAQKP
ncbi:MAG: acyl carrier protein [Coxiellaceae bacterium]|jgi:acyl carrier protein|nr:acyl carrier protein [Coxiellaceae bacterium]